MKLPWCTGLLAMVSVALVSVPLAAQSVFPGNALALLQTGQVAEARELALAAHEADRTNVDALVILGTADLYSSMVLRPDETIYHPVADLKAAWNPVLPLRGVQAAAVWWKDVPTLDPSRNSVWEDLSGLYFDAGSLKQALDYGRLAVAVPGVSGDTLHRVAYLAGLAQGWPEMVSLLQGMTDSANAAREALLYRALGLWRTNDQNWKTAMKAFLATPGAAMTGTKLAAYLLSDKPRDTDAGYQELLTVEPGFPNLLVKQKYADRFSELFAPRLDLARNLAQYGNYDRALELYIDLERRQLAKTPDEKAALALNAAWAWESAGRYPEATNAWKLVAVAKDFYARSAACWFLGRSAREGGQLAEARSWWTQVADEPARSKYAAWCATELKKLN
ncbi:MAG: hypothetical protein WCG80_11670 [Spirochaetales bacterium]